MIPRHYYFPPYLYAYISIFLVLNAKEYTYIQIKLNCIGVLLAKSPKSKKSRVEGFEKTIDLKIFWMPFLFFPAFVFIVVFFFFPPFLFAPLVLPSRQRWKLALCPLRLIENLHQKQERDRRGKWGIEISSSLCGGL